MESHHVPAAAIATEPLDVGDIVLSENGERRVFRPGDVVYIPQQKGLVV